MRELPQMIDSEDALDALLAEPSEALTALMPRLRGDIIVLGIGGKMGTTLGVAAAHAICQAGCAKRVFGVSRFSAPEARAYLEDHGVRTIPCDLLDQSGVAQLPQVENVIYMVGRKFGTGGSEYLTWATNVLVPSNVASHFRDSRLVVFSTGCVYPLVKPASGGCTEATPPDPVGEYAQSCLGRERILEYWSRATGCQMCFLRLNYAVGLRYGVLYDIGCRVYAGDPVDLAVSHVNLIWQGDANRQALLALELCDTPPAILNVTGPETAPVRSIAERFAELFDTEARFVGEASERGMYLSNAGEAAARFGYPSVPLDTMIRWQADWIRRGGPVLEKPTHYGVTDGQF